MTIATLARPRPSPAASAVTIRALSRGEIGPVTEVFAGLSPRSRFLRFLAPLPRLTASALARLTDVDDRDHVALVAESVADTRAIAIARLVRDAADHTSAEAAVEVVDAWQHQGIGTLLATALTERARAGGIRRLTFVMSPDNEGALRLAHHVTGDLDRVAIDEWTAEFTIAMTDPNLATLASRTMEGED